MIFFLCASPVSFSFSFLQLQCRQMYRFMCLFICFYQQGSNPKILWEYHCFSSLRSRLELGSMDFFLILFFRASFPIDKEAKNLNPIKRIFLLKVQRRAAINWPPQVSFPWFCQIFQGQRDLPRRDNHNLIFATPAQGKGSNLERSRIQKETTPHNRACNPLAPPWESSSNTMAYFVPAEKDRLRAISMVQSQSLK